MKLLFATAIVLSTCFTSFGAERVPGTKVFIDAPEGFTKATQFPGFMMESMGASILVSEIPAPVSEIIKGFNVEAAAARGLTLIDKRDVRVAPGKALLLQLGQVANGIDIEKWMLVFGNEKETVMVAANYPKAVAPDMSEILKKAVLSTRWDVAAKVDFFEGLTFRVKEHDDLKIAQKIGNNLMLTRDAVFPQKDRSAPFVAVGSSLTESWTAPEDKMAYARERLGQTKHLTTPSITAETNITLDGLEACVMEAEGRDADTGETLYALHALLYSPDGYYIFQAFVHTSERETYASVFYAILGSFKRV